MVCHSAARSAFRRFHCSFSRRVAAYPQAESDPRARLHVQYERVACGSRERSGRSRRVCTRVIAVSRSARLCLLQLPPFPVDGTRLSHDQREIQFSRATKHARGQVKRLKGCLPRVLTSVFHGSTSMATGCLHQRNEFICVTRIIRVVRVIKECRVRVAISFQVSKG